MSPYKLDNDDFEEPQHNDTEIPRHDLSRPREGISFDLFDRANTLAMADQYRQMAENMERLYNTAPVSTASTQSVQFDQAALDQVVRELFSPIIGDIPDEEEDNEEEIEYQPGWGVESLEDDVTE